MRTYQQTAEDVMRKRTFGISSFEMIERTPEGYLKVVPMHCSFCGEKACDGYWLNGCWLNNEHSPIAGNLEFPFVALCKKHFDKLPLRSSSIVRDD